MEKHAFAEADQGRADNAILVQIMRMRREEKIKLLQIRRRCTRREPRKKNIQTNQTLSFD